jgi:hypothetical protein
MKGWKMFGIILVVLILLFILGVFLIARTPNSSTEPITQNVTPASPSAPPPTAIAQGFYAWYLRGEINDENFASSSDYTSGLSQWLTPNFLANYQTAAANTDVNPFTQSQDYEDSWATNIQTTIISQTNTLSTILVTLGTGSDTQNLILQLLPIGGYWKIDSIELKQ